MCRNFNVHSEVRIKPDDQNGIENLFQYIIRNTFSLEKLKYFEKTYTVLYHSKMARGKNKKIFQIFTPQDFIAAMTQHIPEPSFQLVELTKNGIFLALPLRTSTISKLAKS